jgi:adenylate kinase family enzyme
VTNSTEKGTKIKACWEAFKQVDDDIVIDLVKNEIELWEKK